MDLLIRTGGEQRLSDFLLWESAYAEFFFTPRMWPDFDGDDLAAAVAEFRGRDRRFGALSGHRDEMTVMARPILLGSSPSRSEDSAPAILFDAAPGLNWGIWTLAAVIGPLLSARRGGGRCGAPFSRRSRSRVPSVSRRLHAAAGRHAVIGAAVAMLLAIAVLLAGDPGWERLTAAFMLWAPWWRRFAVLGEAVRRADELGGLVATPRYRPLLRGALLALPVVGLFTLILANADPVLATLRDDLADALARLEFVPRLMFFGAPRHPRLGGCGIVMHRGSVPAPALGGAGSTPRARGHRAPRHPRRGRRALRRVPSPAAQLSLRQRPGRIRDRG